MMDFIKDETGQGMAEYSFVIGFVSIAAIVVLIFFGKRVVDMFAGINDSLIPTAS